MQIVALSLKIKKETKKVSTIISVPLTHTPSFFKCTFKKKNLKMFRYKKTISVWILVYRLNVDNKLGSFIYSILQSL